MAVDPIQELIASLVNAKSYKERAEAGKRLLAHGSAVVDPLLSLLSHREAEVRETVASVLRELRDARARDPLMARLSGDSSYEVRSTAACALIEMGMTDALFIALKDRDVHVRLDAASVAAKTADEALTSRLLTEAHSPPSANADYIEGVMTCLGQIKRPEVVDSLISLLKRTSPVVRQNAAMALGLQGDPQAMQPLAEALGDPEYKVRSAAVDALGHMKNPAVLTLLDRALRDSVYDVRRCAVCVLCDLRDPRAIPLLQQQIGRESQPHVREWIAQRLRRDYQVTDDVVVNPAEADTPALSFLERLMGVFISPAETFADVARKPGFWAPLIAIVLGAVAVIETMIWKIGVERLARMGIEQSGRASSMTPEQIDQAVSTGVKIARVTMPIFAVLGPPIVLLIIAGIGLVIVNVILGAQAKFKTVFSLVCYADLVSLLGALMAVAMILFGDLEHFNAENAVPSNVGFFLNPHEVSKPLYSLATSADILTIWLLILLGVGLSKGTGGRVKPLPIFLIYAGFWLVWVLGKAGLRLIM